MDDRFLAHIPTLRLNLPNFLAAKGRARAEFFHEDFYSARLKESLGLGRPELPIDLLESREGSWSEVLQDPARYVAKHWNRLQGFVAYDNRKRYQLDFPLDSSRELKPEKVTDSTVLGSS